MEKQVKSAKSEKILLGLTTLFLCGLLFLSWQDGRRLPEAELTLETELPATEEELIPEPVVLDLNTAGAVELEQLPGIGEKLARRILEYRGSHGRFETVEELLEVPGIGEGKLAGIRGNLTIK